MGSESCMSREKTATGNNRVFLKESLSHVVSAYIVTKEFYSDQNSS